MSAEVKKHFTAALKQVQGAIAALDGDDVPKALKCALKADEETAKALNLLAATEASTDFFCTRSPSDLPQWLPRYYMPGGRYARVSRSPFGPIRRYGSLRLVCRPPPWCWRWRGI